MGWMWVLWLLALVALVLIVRRGFAPRDRIAPTEQSPEQLLKARYARGEIEKKEYNRRLRDLRR